MTEAADLARRHGVRLHTHLAETDDEESFCRERFGATPTEYVDSLGWLGDDVWMAHAVHLDDAAVARFAATGTGVAHCPSSNARLGAGIARTRDLRRRRRAGRPRGRRCGVQRGRLADRGAAARGAVRPGPRRADGAVGARGAASWRRWAAPGCSAGPTRSGRSRSASSPTSRCGGVDTLPHAGIDDPVAALVLGSAPPLELLLVDGRPVVERDRLVTVDEDELARDAVAAVARCCSEEA